MAISTIPGAGLSTGSSGVAPGNLSTGGPSWDGSGNLTITGGLIAVGSVLQVVVGSTTTSTATTSTAAAGVTTTLTASITPKSATSKVLVGAFFGCIQSSQGTAAGYATFSLYRGASQIITTWFRGPTNLSSNTSIHTPGSGIYLDSPATTSSTTYTVYFNTTAATVTQTVQVSSVPSYIVLLEVGA